MESPIVPYRSLIKSEQTPGPKATSGYHQLAMTDMYTCTPGLTVTLNGQQVVGWPELSHAQPEFAISHSVSKHKGELCITINVSCVSLIISTLQAVLCYNNFLLGRMQDPQACAQLLALTSYPSTFFSNLVAIIQSETAIASIQYMNTAHDAVHYEEVWSMKGQLLCKYSYQFSPALATQKSLSVMGAPVAKLKTTDVVSSVPVVYPPGTIGKLGTPKTHIGGKPTPLKGTRSLLQTSVYYINSEHKGIGNQKPPDTTNTTNHQGCVLTSLPFGTHFRGHSLKHLVVSCLLTFDTQACTAAGMKTIPKLVNLTQNGLELQEIVQFRANLVHAVKGIQLPDNQLTVVYQLPPSIPAIECTRIENCCAVNIIISYENLICIQPDRKSKQESRILMQNGQAMSGRDLLSQLNTEQTQDAMGSITVNTSNVLSSKSTHSFKSIASDSIASPNRQEMYFLNQTMQKPDLTTTHLLPKARQIVDKVWGRLLSFCTCMYSCNNTPLSLPLCVYSATEGMQPPLMRTPGTVNPFIVRSSMNCSDYAAEFGKPSKTTSRTNKPTRKARNVEPFTNGERKKSKVVAISQNISHLKQGTRVHTDTTRLGKLSSINIYPWLVIKLQTLDDTVYLLIDAYGYHPSNLYNQTEDVLNVLGREATVNHQSSVNFHNAFKNIATRGIQMLTTSKQTSLTYMYASTHMRDSVLITLWDGYCSHHVMGTVPWHSNHTSAAAGRMEHNVVCVYVPWQKPNKYGNRQPHNFYSLPAIVLHSLAKCEKPSFKVLCCTQAVSKLLDCGLMMLSAEVRQALSNLNISPLQCNSLTFESRILGLSACTHSEAVHNCPNKDKDRVLSFSPQSPSETELSIGDMICHGKPKSDQFLLPLIETEIKPLSLQEPLINTYKLIIKHLSAVQERNLDSMTIKESAALESLHHLTIRPQLGTAPSNLPPLHVSKNSDHNGTSDGTNGNSSSSSKGSTGRDGSSSGRENRGERRDKGGEDSCDKSGGDGGGSYGDGGGSDGEGKKPNRKDQRNHRPQSKKKRKKRGERKRGHSKKQSSSSPTEKMKKKKQNNLEHFPDIAISLNKAVLDSLPTEEFETMTLKPSHFPTTIIKPHPRKSPSKPSMPLYGRYMYSKRDRRRARLSDSVHTYNNNAHDSNDVGKYGGERDSDRKEEKLSSKILKCRRPRHKRRRKRRGRREKGKKRRLRNKKRSRNCYRLNSQQGRSYDQPYASGAVFMTTRVSSRSQCIQQYTCVVPASSVLRNGQHLSFERCQNLMLIHTRSWDVHGKWLHYKPITKTSQTYSIIVHGRLLIRAQERHFSSDNNGGISRATTLLAPPAARPSFNLFIPDSRLNAQCISVANRQCPTPQSVNAVYDDLEDYQSAPYFPPPIMEQNVMVCVTLSDSHKILLCMS
jgi:hypothetical protein